MKSPFDRVDDADPDRARRSRGPDMPAHVTRAVLATVETADGAIEVSITMRRRGGGATGIDVGKALAALVASGMK